MKKILVSIVFILTVSFTYSQTNYFGIRAGANVSNLDFTPDATFANQHRNGFMFGAFADFGFSESLSLLTELQWSAEGAKDRSLRANYLNLPIMLRFHFGDLTVGAGPQASLKIWEDQDAFSTFAVSGIAGAEYMITEEIFIDIRYSYGITNVIDEDITTTEARNTNIQFGVGIKL